MDSEEQLNKITFGLLIRETLRNHPDWLKDAMDAIHSGMQDILADAGKQIAIHRSAADAAITLASSRKLGPKITEVLRKRILDTLNPQNMNLFELELAHAYEKNKQRNRKDVFLIDPEPNTKTKP